MTSAAQPGLDKQIVDTFAVVGLLIAVATGYLAAIWPVVADLLTRRPPSADDDRADFARRCLSYTIASVVFVAVASALLVIVSPLVVDSVQTFDRHEDIDPIRSAVVLFAALLVLGALCGVRLAYRLGRRYRDVRP